MEDNLTYHFKTSEIDTYFRKDPADANKLLGGSKPITTDTTQQPIVVPSENIASARPQSLRRCYHNNRGYY